MKIKICDLCGAVIENSRVSMKISYRVKIKRIEAIPLEKGYGKATMKVDICEECAERIADEVIDARTEDDE